MCKIFLARGRLLDYVMKVYVANITRLEGDTKQTQENPVCVIQDANILDSFFYANEFTENVVIPNCKNFLLDSGAFTFLQSGKKVDWRKYVREYADFVIRNRVKDYFELDIDKIVGFNNVLKIRQYLAEKIGVLPIPVWHRSRGYQQFLDDAERYPYVAIGGIAIKDIKRSEFPVFHRLIQDAHDRGAKVHGLGFTAMSELPKYKFDTVDSSSWSAGNRFGFVYMFDGEKMIQIQKPPGKRVKSSETAVHNFLEWKKFCEYAEVNL